MLKPYKTAIVRKKLSMPTQYLVDNKLILGSVLDYGCGHGYDGIKLGADLYDPFYYRKDRKKIFSSLYDTIICNYVLNVVTQEEQLVIISKIRKLLSENGIAYISVRRDIKGSNYTSIGTLQIECNVRLDSLTKNSGYEIYKMEKSC